MLHEKVKWAAIYTSAVFVVAVTAFAFYRSPPF